MVFVGEETTVYQREAFALNLVIPPILLHVVKWIFVVTMAQMEVVGKGTTASLRILYVRIHATTQPQQYATHLRQDVTMVGICMGAGWEIIACQKDIRALLPV